MTLEPIDPETALELSLTDRPTEREKMEAPRKSRRPLIPCSVPVHRDIYTVVHSILDKEVLEE